MCPSTVQDTLHNGMNKRRFCDERDGNIYFYVKIDRQEWMAENLKYDARGSKCYNNDDCNTYGRYYSLSITTDTDICPKGWSLPGIGNWETMMRYFNKDCETSPCIYSGISKYLRVKDWYGLDSLGFSALPGGCDNGNTNNYSACWWSNIIENTSNANYIIINNTANVAHDVRSINAFLNVRCMRNVQ